jgi:hypothetical protein
MFFEKLLLVITSATKRRNVFFIFDLFIVELTK